MLSQNVVNVVPTFVERLSQDPVWLTALVTNDLNAWFDWMDAYPDIEATDSFGMTPLHWACFLQRPRMVEELLALGADAFKLDHDGLFPWQLAMRHRSTNSWNWAAWPARFPQAFNKKWSEDAWDCVPVGRAILQACVHERFDVLQALTSTIPAYECPGVMIVQPKTTYERSSKIPWTLLPWSHALVLLDLEASLPVLLHWGIDVNALDGDRRSAVQWAVSLQCPVLADALIHAGACLIPRDDEQEHELPDAITVATLTSPQMAEWVSQWLQPSDGDSLRQNVILNNSLSMQERRQEVWDQATQVHGAAAMVNAVVESWKRKYRWNLAQRGSDGFFGAMMG